MSDRKWGLWLLASALWFFAHSFITMVATDEQRAHLGTNWFFVFGFVLSIVNLLFCIFVGSEPSDEETI